jgi:hypothetical protein
VAISSFTATDNIGVTGYLVNELATDPSATANGWSVTAPTSYTFTTAGTKTLYAWAKDAAGNVSSSRSASVIISIVCNPTIPTNPSASDTGAVELGVKFKLGLNGFIKGIRFYKGTGNTGTHVGNLWTLNGQRLATATFTNETATGWQEVNFASPIAITANTVYVASYYAPNGGYAYDYDYFASTGCFQNGQLYFLRNGENGGNGVYVYSASTRFPNNTWRATNYWVDPVFITGTGSDTIHP